MKLRTPARNDAGWCNDKDAFDFLGIEQSAEKRNHLCRLSQTVHQQSQNSPSQENILLADKIIAATTYISARCYAISGIPQTPYQG